MRKCVEVGVRQGEAEEDRLAGESAEAIGIDGLPEPRYLRVVACVLGLVYVAILHSGHAAHVAHLPRVFREYGSVALHRRVHETPNPIRGGDPVIVHE